MTEQSTPEQMFEQQKAQCIFCHIISGAKPSLKVYEDNLVVAILDIAPANKGHVLLMPKEHYPIMPAVPEQVLTHLFKIAKEISQVLLKTMVVGGTNIFIANGGAAGQQAPHFMIHIIPREEHDNVDVFYLRKIETNPQKLTEMQKALAGNLHLKLQDKLAEQGLLAESQISQQDLFKLIESNPKIKQFLLSNINDLDKVVKTNPQLEMMFKGKDLEKIKQFLQKPKEEAQLEQVSQLLKGKKVVRKDKEKELLKEIEQETEETPEEKALREKLSVKEKKEINQTKTRFKKEQKKELETEEESQEESEQDNKSEPEDESQEESEQDNKSEPEEESQEESEQDNESEPEDESQEESEQDNESEPEDESQEESEQDNESEPEEEADLDEIANLLTGGTR